MEYFKKYQRDSDGLFNATLFLQDNGECNNRKAYEAFRSRKVNAFMSINESKYILDPSKNSSKGKSLGNYWMDFELFLMFIMEYSPEMRLKIIKEIYGLFPESIINCIQESSFECNLSMYRTYLMYNSENKLFKIGKSLCPKSRLSEIQSFFPETQIVFSIPCNIESFLHSHFLDCNIIVSGFTEWFYLSMLDIEFIINKGFESSFSEDFINCISKIYIETPIDIKKLLLSTRNEHVTNLEKTILYLVESGLVINKKNLSESIKKAVDYNFNKNIK